MYAQQRRRLITVSVIVAILCAALTVFRVFDLPHAIAVIAAALTVDSLITADRSRATDDWPQAPIKFRSGARSEVARLSWATVGRDGNVTESALHRVRLLAQQLLAERGIQWSGEPGSPMTPGSLAQELLGKEAFRTLTTTQGVRPRALLNTVAQLEKLPAPTDYVSTGKLIGQQQI